MAILWGNDDKPQDGLEPYFRKHPKIESFGEYSTKYLKSEQSPTIPGLPT
jgi:hypothetical protein